MRRRGGVRHGGRIDGPETRHDRIRPRRTQTADDHAVILPDDDQGEGENASAPESLRTHLRADPLVASSGFVPPESALPRQTVPTA